MGERQRRIRDAQGLQFATSARGYFRKKRAIMNHLTDDQIEGQGFGWGDRVVVVGIDDEVTIRLATNENLSGESTILKSSLPE